MSQHPCSPTQPDVSPGSPPPKDKVPQKRTVIEVLAESSPASPEAPFTQKPHATTRKRRHYSDEDIQQALVELAQFSEELKAHVRTLGKLLKLHEDED